MSERRATNDDVCPECKRGQYAGDNMHWHDGCFICFPCFYGHQDRADWADRCTCCLTERATSLYSETIKLCDECDLDYHNQRAALERVFSGEKERARINGLIALYKRTTNETTRNWCIADVSVHIALLFPAAYPERERHIDAMLNDWLGGPA